MMGQIERSFSYYSLMVPTYIVNLDLPPEKRWQQVAASKSKQVNNDVHVSNITSTIIVQTSSDSFLCNCIMSTIIQG
jgi:hypothetical protein